MAKITGFKMRGKTLTEVFVDEKSFCKMHADAVVANGLKSGMDIDIEKLNRIQYDSNLILAKEKALNMVSKNIKTEKQVFDSLLQKGFEKNICSKCVDFLREYKYINDAEYVKMFINCKQQKFGKKRIELELMKKGVKKETISKELSSIQFDFEKIFSSLEKFMRNKEKDIKGKTKAYRFLASRGFSNDECMLVISKYFGGEEE